MSVWEGNVKEIMRLVGMGGKWEEIMTYFGIARKWEGNQYLCWWGKKMGRKNIYLLVWEEIRKE